MDTRLNGQTKSSELHVVLPEAVPRRPAAFRAALTLSWLLVPVIVVASVMGLFLHGLYHEGAWAREALRGGDLVSLVLVAPLLAGSLVLTMRGSRRAVAVWIGCLAYAAYNYAFYALGATFNDAFIFHVAAMSLAVYAIGCAIVSLSTIPVSTVSPEVRAPRTIGWFLVVVGVLQGLLWVFVIVRNALTGEVIHNIPIAGQHLVLALDLGLSMPAIVLAGVLLARRAPLGFLLGPAMAVMGAAYQVNLMVSGVFQANANVAGVTAFAPESVLLTIGFVAAAAVSLFAPRRRGVRPSYGGATRGRSAG